MKLITFPFSRTSMMGWFGMIMLLVLGGCKKKSATIEYKEMDPAYSSYVYAYTSGIISRADPILIKFNDIVVDLEKAGQKLQSKLISFSPSLDGTAVWEDGRTLKFIPSEPMPSGTRYDVNVKLGKVYKDVPSNLSNFDFAFHTKQQNFNIEFEGLHAPEETNLAKQQLFGMIRTADLADNEQVEEMLEFYQKGNKNLAVTWTHTNNQRDHKFIVDKVVRGESASAINASWNGKKIGVDQKDKRELEVPALGDFKVMDAKVVQEKEQYILAIFSDPLLKTQNMKGLVKISNGSDDNRYTIDGNRLRIYTPRRIQGTHDITFLQGIKNTANFNMKNKGEWTLSFEGIKPGVRLVGKGVILPDNNGLIFPFEAVSLNSIDVEVFKIYQNNILQFLQNNEYDGSWNLRQVGRVVHQQKVNLTDLNPNAKYETWNRYALDLSNMVEKDPAAIYQVRLGFKKDYSSYPCNSGSSTSSPEDNLVFLEPENVDEYGDIISFWDQDRWYWDYEGYEYRHREDPCYPPYYTTNNFVRRNVIGSDLGIIAKRGNDGSAFVAISNLLTTEPIAGAKVEFYDFQQQLISSLTTDSDGVVMTELKKKPFFVVAHNGAQRGYLKMDDGSSLSLSRFDVAGNKTFKGIKGFLYGERGVWRPGDSIYLTFIVEDKLGKLPKNHPVTFEFYDPKGQLQQKTTRSQNVNNMYNFSTATADDAPTGNWNAKLKVGGASFNNTVKVETVKPNRLKIDLDFGKEELAMADKNLNGKLKVNWLHACQGCTHRN